MLVYYITENNVCQAFFEFFCEFFCISAICYLFPVNGVHLDNDRLFITICSFLISVTHFMYFLLLIADTLYNSERKFSV